MLLALLACAGTPPDDTHFDGVDLRIDHQTDRDNTIRFDSPDYVVPPYADQTMCTFATYEGEEAAIRWAGFFQNLEVGHHVVLMASTADPDEWPDGAVANCTETDADIMTEARPFLFAGDLSGGLQPEMVLPEAMAVKLKSGTRFVVQSHHINTTGEPILVNDTVFLQLDDVDAVETWTAPWVHVQTDFEIPPQESLEIEVTCAFDDDVHVLSLLGHLHEWGTTYAVDYNKEDGTTERIYDIPQWDVQYRDAPPINVYQPGEFPVKAGESFTTTCAWTNDTDEPLGFPVEMCATVGFAYPQTVALVCEPDV